MKCLGDLAKSVCGYGSINYLSRQVCEAYRNGKVEEAMSFGFLIFLFSGDLTNFAGCYLTSQLPIQVSRLRHIACNCSARENIKTYSSSDWRRLVSGTGETLIMAAQKHALNTRLTEAGVCHTRQDQRCRLG